MTETSSPVSIVAERYASALFELAADDKAIEAVESDLDRLDALIGESADLQRLVKSPVFSADDQIKALDAVLEKVGIGGLVANFVRLAAKNRRLFTLPEMIRGYRALTAAHRGEISADVTSAEALTDEQVADLGAALKKVTGKDVKLNRAVDPALIGGLVVRLGSRMIDTSIRTKLNSLKIALKEVG